MEIGVEFAPVSGETSVVQIVPNGLHEGVEAHVAEMIGEHQLEVFIDREHRHGVEVGHHGVYYFLRLLVGEGMVVENVELVLVESLDWNHEHGGVCHHLHPLIAAQQKFALAEGLAQVCRHGYAASYGVRFVNHLFFGGAV